MSGTACQTETDPGESTTRFPWRPLLLLAFGAFWTVTLEMLPAGLLPAMTADLGVRPSRIGLLVTIWALTVGVTTMPLSRATRRWRRPSVIATSLVLVGAATVMTALAPSYLSVAATRVVAAAGHGLFWSALMVYAASLAPAGRTGRAMSVVLTGPTLASVVGLPLGTWLTAPIGWRWVVGLLGVAMVALAALLARVLPDAGPPRTNSRPSEGRDPTVFIVVATAVFGALALLAHFVVFTFVAPLVTHEWDLEGGSLSVVLLVFGVAGAVGLGLSGAIPDRLGKQALIMVVAMLACTFALLAVLNTQPWVQYGLVALWGVLLGMLPPLLQAGVIGVASPAFRDTAGAILVTIFNLGVAAGAVIGGVAIDGWGLMSLLPVAVAASVLSAAGLLVLSHRGEPMGAAR